MFPEAVRIGREWSVRWVEVLEWEKTLKTYKQQKELGWHTKKKYTDPARLDHEKIFDRPESDGNQDEEGL